VDRIVRLYRVGKLGFTVATDGPRAAPVRTTFLMPWLQRSLEARLKVPPRTSGWCRTRWRCATLAAQLRTKHGLEVSAWTVRRWLHELGWVWKRAQLVAKDDDPERVERLARIRLHAEQVQAHAVMVFADALDLHLLPKVGAAWRPKGSQEAVMTPGKNEKYSLAGALNLATGQIVHCRGPRKTHAFFRDLLTLLDRTSPQRWVRRISVVVDNDNIQKAKAVGQWFATHPRFALLWLPTYCPRANPLERACGDVHDTCTRHHKRKRLRDLVSDVVWHLHANGPWLYKLSHLYDAPEVTAAVARIALEEQNRIAA
jgi:transposase